MREYKVTEIRTRFIPVIFIWHNENEKIGTSVLTAINYWLGVRT